MAQRVKPTRTADVYGQLREDLLAGRLEPGARVKINELAARFGVSLSVVREAMTRLSEQSLIIASPQRGFSVIALTESDLCSLTDARMHIECLVLERSIAEGDRQWEGQVMATHHVMASTPMQDSHGVTSVEWSNAHRDFHAALLAGCSNHRLTHLATTLREEGELYRLWAGSLAGERSRDVADEHLRIMKATLARDSQLATNELGAHIQQTSEILLSFLAKGKNTAGS